MLYKKPFLGEGARFSAPESNLTGQFLTYNIN